MIRFFLKSFCIMLLFFVGIILGMQKANTGLVQMRGYEDPSLYSAASIDEKDGEIDARLLGTKFNSHDLEDKKKKMQEMKAFNAFSTLGKKATEGTKEVTERIIGFIVRD
ncbi:DUF3679 domain-containing protein [Bacillus sp. 1P06AnD]|uniref:DUF3679 domain-containing protein n=1 Tax=Bacillus sp. 1P06AnD TaxID=3132208 RepID=UPI0039A0F43F